MKIIEGDNFNMLLKLLKKNIFSFFANLFGDFEIDVSLHPQMMPDRLMAGQLVLVQSV